MTLKEQRYLTHVQFFFISKCWYLKYLFNDLIFLPPARGSMRRYAITYIRVVRAAKLRCICSHHELTMAGVDTRDGVNYNTNGFVEIREIHKVRIEETFQI